MTLNAIDRSCRAHFACVAPDFTILPADVLGDPCTVDKGSCSSKVDQDKARASELPAEPEFTLYILEKDVHVDAATSDVMDLLRAPARQL